MKRALLLAVLVLAGCVDGPPDPSRVGYNNAVALMADADKLDEAIRVLEDVRSHESGDPELRFRAAFAQGVAHARQAEAAAAEGAGHDATVAVERYGEAAEAFVQAKKVRPDDAATQQNLEIVHARILALVDEANRGKHGLEHRLNELIAGERGLRDAARGLWTAQDARTTHDPLADKDQFDRAATRQRILGAEAGVLADLAGAEITAIGGKAEAQRSDEEKGRLVQLQNLDLYVQDARKEMVDARRNLAELQGELAYRRTEGALGALKRAREQLLDPVTVLREVAKEQAELMELAGQVAAARSTVKLGETPPAIPAWMEPVALSGVQLELHARLEEVRARLAAVSGAPDSPDAKPELQRAKQQVAVALPFIEQGAGAMRQANEALRGGELAGGLKAQQAALEAMAQAVEAFLDLRGLIDLTLAAHQPVVEALSPEAAGVTAADRARIVGDGARQTADRLTRMQQMIADQLAEASAGDDEQAKQQAQQLYARAETLRAEALAANAALRAVGEGAKGGAPPLESAKTTQARLEELQKLFFSVVEHLKQLIRDQGETSDRTAAAVAMDDLARKPALPQLVQREGEHHQMGEAIGEALAAQADAAAQAPPQPPGQQPTPQAQQGPSPAQLQEAVAEVRNAVVSMQDASDTLTKAADPAATMSFDLAPAQSAQKTALEHLEAALALLTPKQDQQQQQGEPPPEPKPDEPKEPDKNQSKDDAERRLQQVREREAQRQRDRREQQRVAPEPVDKDW